MIDINSAIRQAFVTALDSQITVDGNLVKVYSEFNPNSTENHYIVLTTQTEEDTSTKSSFDTSATILVKIVHCNQQRNNASYDDVDYIANEVLQIIQPTATTHIGSPDASLQFVNVRRLSSNTLYYTTDSYSETSRLLRFQLRIKES
jgi:hypothetical protein